ncbi:MAG: hypothetical protein OEZ13_03600 [Spirochaetia bacterium]|nr:hypothetical protein [Spirochaetia bacterium]
MLKPFLFFFELIYYSAAGFVNVFKRFLISIIKSFVKLHWLEKIYILTAMITAIMLTQGWRSYRIPFGSDIDKSHQIYTDDFLSIIIFLILSLTPSVFIVFEVSLKKKKLLFFLLRFAGLTGMSALYYFNYINPERMAPVKQAEFTWQFYSISAFLLILWISGFLGLNQAQKS